jgi:Tol biopolymer transport system component
LIGQTLSHYRVTAALGSGGMGEVYRATDTSLGRDVAIKVLPPEVAHDPDRLQRFKREAHLLASLNHPHIAAIYGLEEADGKPFLALELVEGEDLKQRLARGALPVAEALEIGEQIAEALEEAHNKGIVHRDLKPANVKLTPDGKVKVLDFGLAKAWAGDASGVGSATSALSQSPTLAHSGTVAGVILGTAAYMSPEQARGKPVDKRADVWSFGVLLWEMLTGHALFAGDTVTDVIAAVVTKEPDLGALPVGTPAAVRRLVSRCLRKDPRRRLPDMGAARLELSDVRAGAAEADAPASAVEPKGAKRRRLRERLVWGFIATALAGLAGVLLWQRLRQPAPEAGSPAHFVVDLPRGVALPAFGPPALSPDGRQLAFAGTSANGVTQVWIRPLDSLDVRPLGGTEGASAPFWSPDGAALAFAAGSEIRKVLLAGGAVQRVCTLPRPGMTGGTWSADGVVVFQSGGASGTLYRVPAAGGEAIALTTLDAARAEQGHYWPQFLPDGRTLLTSVASTQAQNAGLFAIRLDAGGERRRVLPDTTRFVHASGRLLTVRDDVLVSLAFDPSRLVASGDAVPVATDVATWNVAPIFGWFSASANGRLAWFPARSSLLRLKWFDREGRPLGTLGEPARYSQLALSPDGRRVAVEIQDSEGQYDIWLIDVARGVSSRLTTDPANNREPVWSPDGNRLAFTTGANNAEDIVVKELSGSEPPFPLPGQVGATPGERDVPENWTRAGDALLFMTLGRSRTFWALPMQGKGKPERLLSGEFNLDEPHVSPDGRWLAYVSTESGRFEVYVEPFRRRGERLRVSDNGGGQPRWRGDGKELFYLTLSGAIASVSVREAGSALELGAPTTLATADQLSAVVQPSDYDDWDVTPDGQRFLVKVSASSAERQGMHVLLDWTAVGR